MSQGQLEELFAIQDTLKMGEDDWVGCKQEVIETENTILKKTQAADYYNGLGSTEYAQELMNDVKQLKQDIVAQKVAVYEAEKLVLEKREEERHALRALLSSMLE